ncbi:trypsin-like peptidase domain-containing protein [Psychrobium sp. 1_MG-2023]|uniref:trypsin-like peptidase domain-containing protein n=1 Tax=Psychrobium sp. 1_MG-2023 TaxID=3062624 RepID=UPI000C344B97|nr:trypsin-like peptidase domain-containing protein [Psychrobium sp. 1_MG-2023]MDP2560691.1 trypsin-like peptidase domain-containing protein [Psychrobium sp. 1_MG-2023]PKF56586.1 outer membrane-stress sensor serine endopeptidase DegS [Alteromonadales bacterium alter-6D02]
MSQLFVFKFVKATIKAIISGLIIGGLIIVLIPSLRPQFSVSIKDWFLTHNAQVSFANAIQRSAPAVVNIYSVTQHLNPLNQIERRDKGLGSGVIMSKSGFIMTNLHVIKGADIIYVALQDGRFQIASVVGTDPLTDLAVLHITLPDLPVIPMNLKRSTQVGDLVLAIGNPYNLGQTITQGIVSATGRKAGLSSSNFLDLIQTDAAINDGNSGGALINSRGDLIGINAASFNALDNGGINGISFAIPINLAYTIMKEIIVEGHVSRGSLGFNGEALNRMATMSLNINSGAVLVSAVSPQGAAKQAGLQIDDVIIEVNKKSFGSVEELRNHIAGTKPGNKISITIIRQGKRMVLDMVTSELRVS